ncbi:MAG TPA: hypothetical protein VGW78_06330 [Candidatus Babeliales bacterium]|jgi:hypothetical protein|nr:hypothetical protein [Candidatus Babeliales bacterium]
MKTISMIYLSFVLQAFSISAGWFSTEQPHITESPVCQKLMDDYKCIATEKEQSDFLWKMRLAAKEAQEKYDTSKEPEKVKKFLELYQCVQFLQRFSGYPSYVQVAKPILDSIDMQKVPDRSVINTIIDTKKGPSSLNKNDAWNLYNCEPCQKIKQMCWDEKGLFNKEACGKLASAISSLVYEDRIDRSSSHAKDHWQEIKTQKLPESIKEKSKIAYACFEIIKAKIDHEKSIMAAEKYLQ